MSINSAAIFLYFWKSLTILILFLGEALFASDFSFQKIVIGAQQASAIGKPAQLHARNWEKNNGAQAEVILTPYRDLFKRYLKSITAKQAEFDVILFPSSWMGDFYPYLASIPDSLLNDHSFDDIHPLYRKRLMTWNNQWLAVTIDGALYSGYYRTDLFNHPQHKKAFQQLYGYTLLPPQSWQQYRDIAEYFTAKSSTQQIIYGTAVPYKRGGQQFWELFSRAAAYTSAPDFLAAQFFDPDTMQAQINNPGWRKATEEYLAIRQFAPPNARDAGIIEARQSFLEGQTAMILDWGDTAQIAATSPNSKVKDKIGFFVLPGSRQAWNSKLWRWQKFASVRKVPFLAFGGWVAGVPKNSTKPQAAWDFIKWYSNPENSLQDLVINGSGINPYHLSHFIHIDTWIKAFSPHTAAEYLKVIQQSLNSPNTSLDLRIPGTVQYSNALEEQLAQILENKIDVQTGLDLVAQQWEAITDQLGRSRQLQIYRQSMGLPALTSKASAIKKFFHGQKYLIGFSQATTTEPWRLLFNKELRQEAAKHSQIKLLVRDGQDRIDKQIADMNEFIRMPVDAILISPKAADALTPSVNKAYAAGIPVFVLDGDVLSKRYTQFIGGDNFQIGQAAGEYALKLLGGKNQAQGYIVEIWGGMQSTPAKQRHDGFLSAISEAPGVQIVSVPKDGDWKLDQGYNIMLEYLEQHPQIDLVYAHNDPMAYGAYLAAKEKNKADKIFFLGIDGIPAEGVKWVYEGILDATFSYNPPGDEAILEVLGYFSGQPRTKVKILDSQTIDKSNAKRILQQHQIQFQEDL